MIVKFCDGTQIRQDLIKSAILRRDLAPIPETFEGEFRIDKGLESKIVEGAKLKIGGAESVHRIIKVERNSERVMQAHREYGAFRITTLLDSCHKLAFVRAPGNAVIKEDAAISCIYRACGATTGIQGCFPVPRFTCLVGETPTFHIARLLQEAAGSIRHKCGSLQFKKYQDMLSQKEVVELQDNGEGGVDTGFLERHEVPWFFATKPDASFDFGKRCKPRAARFAPLRGGCALGKMTDALVLKKVLHVDHMEQVHAGDSVKLVSDGSKLVVTTVAHVYNSGTDGSAEKHYSRIWLSSVE